MRLHEAIRSAAGAGDAAGAREILAKAVHGKNGKDGNDEAVAAFQSDMRPVCGAVVSALEAGDVEALKGLRALLPHLLADVNREPALADLLAHQLGKAFLAGLRATPEEAL